MEKASRVEKFHTSEEDFSGYERASFGARAIAVIIDGVIMGVLGQIAVSLISIALPQFATTGVGMAVLFSVNAFIVPFFYYVPMMKSRGQTIGKAIMKIKVINDDQSEGLETGQIIMREFVGKLISSIVFLIGYLVFLFGKETWHDRIAKTRVVVLK